MLILGVSAYFHDAAAAIVLDGKVLAAAQEERFTRIKNDASFPIHAVRYCMEFAGATLDELARSYNVIRATIARLRA